VFLGGGPRRLPVSFFQRSNPALRLVPPPLPLVELLIQKVRTTRTVPPRPLQVINVSLTVELIQKSKSSSLCAPTASYLAVRLEEEEKRGGRGGGVSILWSVGAGGLIFDFSIADSSCEITLRQLPKGLGPRGVRKWRLLQGSWSLLGSKTRP